MEGLGGDAPLGTFQIDTGPRRSPAACFREIKNKGEASPVRIIRMLPMYAATHMRLDVCRDMCMDLRMHMRTDMYTEMGIDMCRDMCIDMCIDRHVFRHVHSHVYGHVHRQTCA